MSLEEHGELEGRPALHELPDGEDGRQIGGDHGEDHRRRGQRCDTLFIMSEVARKELGAVRRHENEDVSDGH